MIEDKLTRDERLRLECLSQAIQSMRPTPLNENQLIDRADKFERYLRNGKRTRVENT